MSRIKTKESEPAEAKPTKSTLKSPLKDTVTPAPLPLHAQGRRTARVCFAVTVVALALWIARDFLAPLAWGTILAIAVWPLYARLPHSTATQRPPLIAPLLVTVLMGVTLLAPFVLATQEIARESEQIMQWITSLRDTGLPVPGWVAQLPIASEQIERWWHSNLADPQKTGSWVAALDLGSGIEWAKALGGQLLHRLLLFFIALLALFVLLRHGAWVGSRVLEAADRVLGDPGERLASKMADAARGTVTGALVVGVAEGLLIGAAYVMAGVPNPVLYALLTVGFAMVPLGAWVAFSTAALMLVLNGAAAWRPLASWAGARR
jgi:predicted PurR-regulated permease PerM